MCMSTWRLLPDRRARSGVEADALARGEVVEGGGDRGPSPRPAASGRSGPGRRATRAGRPRPRRSRAMATPTAASTRRPAGGPAIARPAAAPAGGPDVRGRGGRRRPRSPASRWRRPTRAQPGRHRQVDQRGDHHHADRDVRWETSAADPSIRRRMASMATAAPAASTSRPSTAAARFSALLVPVRVVLVGGARRGAHPGERDRRGHEVAGRVRRVGQDRHRAGHEADDELDDRRGSRSTPARAAAAARLRRAFVSIGGGR